VTSGEWNDPYVSNRDFVWATIDIPGPRNLNVVCAHFLTSSEGERNAEAQSLVAYAQSQFAPEDLLVVAGDFNTENRNESCLFTLASLVSDGRQPADQNGNRNTNQGRVRPYDYVLPNGPMEAWHAPVIVDGVSFPDGIVFDSRLWTNPPRPILTGDANSENMQHMPVMKMFAFPTGVVISAQIQQLVDQGNGNSLLETGETVHAYFRVRNDGAVTATQVVLNVESLSAGLIMTSVFTEALGDVAVASAVTSQVACVIQIATNAQAGDNLLQAALSWNGSTVTNNLVIPVFINRITEALDNEDLEWTFWGSWEYQTAITYDGVDALMSDYVPGNSMNWIKAVVEGPGIMTWAWSIRASGSNPGYLFSQRNDGFDFQFKSSSSWQIYTNIIPAGTHTMEWYHVNYSALPSRSTGLLDRVVYDAYTNPVLWVSETSVAATIREGGAPVYEHLVIQNIGDGSMNFTATVNAAWVTLDQFGDDLTANQQFGYVGVTVDPAMLATGSYQAAVIISAPGAVPGAVTVAVSLVVSGPMANGAGSTNLVFFTAGDASWFIQAGITHDGASAARSGHIPHFQQSYIETEVIGPGILGFWWKVSSELNYDFLTVQLNTSNAASISGNVDWQFRQYALTAGVHQVRWTYSKDGSVTSFLDAAFLDEVSMVGVPDRDADGLPDAWEAQYFGSTTGAVPSDMSDADDFSDYEEYISDTDPTDAQSYFDGVVNLVPGNGLLIDLWPTSTQRVYDLLGSTDLVAQSWRTITGGVAGTGGNLLMALTNTLDHHHFRGGVRIDD
jgi:hypothetical protein